MSGRRGSPAVELLPPITYKRHVCPTCNGPGFVRRVDPASLRARREMADLTLRDLAKRHHLSAAYISDVELGRRNVTDRIVEMYEAL